ncbi:MAG: pyruvate kinase [candidate division WOR-3 bacterium]
MKLTKIVATVGPSVDSLDKMRSLIEEGVNLFRFNFSHGTLNEHLQKINWIRSLRDDGLEAGVFVDLGGPKFRLGEFGGDGKAYLEPGQTFRLTLREVEGNNLIAYAPLHQVLDNLRPGDSILLADGTIELEVVEVESEEVITRVRIGGEVSSHKGINIPYRMGNISAITEKDIKDLQSGINAGVNIFALSFVGSADDVLKAKEIAKSFGAEIYVISKIERAEALDNLRGILDVSDAIMVARGDLAVEIPYYKVPVVQKELITQALKKGRPVITATHMLRSILYSPVPSRSEISDIANAVLDGSSALMLSEETAIASNPVNSVAVMKRIVLEVEGYIRKNNLRKHVVGETGDLEMRIAESAVNLAISLNAKAIITPTASGATALRVASLMPPVPIVAITESDNICEFLNLAYGVYPFKVKKMTGLGDMIEYIKPVLLNKGFVYPGDTVVITAGYPFGKPGTTNMVKVEKI